MSFTESFQPAQSPVPRKIADRSSLSFPPLRNLVEHNDKSQFTNSKNTYPHDAPRLPATASRIAHAGDSQICSTLARPYPDSSDPDVLSEPHMSSVEPSDDDYSPSSPSPRSSTGAVRPTKSHSRRQSPDHIPRPKNAFILYRSWYVQQGCAEIDHREISRIVGTKWNSLPDLERKVWKARAEIEKKEHAAKYPNYKYSPNARRDTAAPVRNSSARNTTTRSRGTRINPSPNKRPSKASKPPISQRRILTDSEPYESYESKEPKATPKRTAPSLTIRVPPHTNQVVAESSLRLSPNPESPPTSSVSTPVATQASYIEDDSGWPVAACHAPLCDPIFSPDPEMTTMRPSVFREGFQGVEALNTLMYYDNQPNESATMGDAYNDSTKFHQYSFMELEYPPLVEPELPSSDIAPDGVQQSYLAPDDLEAHLNFSSADSGPYFGQPHQPAPAEDTQSPGNKSTPDDLSLFAEWLVEDSPVFVGEPIFADELPQTPTSSGAPSPSLSLEVSTPTQPHQPVLLCDPWFMRPGDFTAHKYAMPGLSVELDERGRILDQAAESGVRI